MEIKISKCAARCGSCDMDFAHEQKVHSQIVLQEGVFTRCDYCAACFEKVQTEEAFCVWNVLYSDPKVLEAERQEVYSPLRRLFYDLASMTGRPDLAEAYLAAQLLKRQKAFRQIKESDENDGAERVTLFLDRAGNRLIETRDLNFTYSELDEARIRLMARLQEMEGPSRNAVEEPESTANESKQV